MAITEPQSNDANEPTVPEQLRQRLAGMERRTAFEIGLALALGVALLGMLISALTSAREFQMNFRSPATVFFAVLVLVLLLAWLAQDRAKRARISAFQLMAEMLHRHLRTEQALRDPLTGAYNRAALQELSARYLSRADRSRENLALVVLDLDDFHDLNSRHGHIAGDVALVEFAHILHSSTRGSDIVARYGGDEFILLLGETPLAGATVVINRVKERVATRNAQLAQGQVPLAFTAGAAVFQKGMDFVTLFREADYDLLQRKAGRRRTAQTADRT